MKPHKVYEANCLYIFNYISFVVDSFNLTVYYHHLHSLLLCLTWVAMSFRIAECRYTKTKVFTLANHKRRNNAMKQSGLEANTVHVCIHAISAPFTCFVSICHRHWLTNITLTLKWAYCHTVILYTMLLSMFHCFLILFQSLREWVTTLRTASGKMLAMGSFLTRI